ncbi:MAG: membrane protein insertase YidC [Acidimicrobiia bacterium]|nr:membrane protein insertase YidC [Acidimicrobiia bacterium]
MGLGQIWDGFLGILGTLLAFFYDAVPSYGISIILLTILINLILFPLTLKQTRSTRAFQTLQPEMQKIRAQYKDEPEKLQKEMVRLQQEHGVSAGGCFLPLIVQMPVLFGLFRVLQNPVDYIPGGTTLFETVSNGTETFLGMNLETTPWEALNSPDGVVGALPYLVLMALMIAAQYVQQWHSTSGQSTEGQPASAQMVGKVMPAFFGVISINFPAGLNVYWATASLFRLGQQAVIFRIDGRPEPMAKAAKSLTGGEDATEEEQGAEPKEAQVSDETTGEGNTDNKSKAPQQGSKKRNKRKRR